MTESSPSPSPSADSNPNLAALRHAYQRWAETKGRSADEILAMFADEVEMRSVLTPDVPNELAGVHLTKARAKDYFDALARDWVMISYEVDRFIANRDDIVMVGRCHWRSRANPAVEVNSPKVDIWHFENGKATSFLEMFDSLQFAKAVGANL